MPARYFSFGPFRLLPDQQRLLRVDVPVRLGSRAMAILQVFVEHAGELISKQDLISQVWPDTFVDESNLKVNIAALRKVLDGDNSLLSHIATVSGRGYRFVAPVTVSELENSVESRRRASNLPISTKHIIGRCEVIQQVIGHLSQCRFLTIVGSGGIGKTTVATAAAETLLQAYKDGICFVDFSSLNDPSRVPHAICAALRLPFSIDNVNEQLNAHLQSREILLVFDTCEHILSAAAKSAELIQSSCPKVHILATSREPLQAKGERLYRLPPLGVPPPNPELTADDIRTFPAIQLFLEQADETFDHLRITDSRVLTIAEVCRQLDGIPLAIELAAIRVRLLGFEGLRSLVDDNFLQFHHGQRTSPQRHQTLAAAFEWSFGLLPENERSALLRLSTLNSSFDLEMALSVASGGIMSVTESTTCIANLVSKSMIERLVHGDSTFRLFNLVRYCASSKALSYSHREKSEMYREQLADVYWTGLPTETSGSTLPARAV